TPDEDVVAISTDAACQGRWRDLPPTRSYPGLIERTSRPSAIEPFGAGCDGYGPMCDTYGTAMLGHRSGEPRVGQQLVLEYDGRDLPFVAAPSAFMAVGFDNVRFGALPLPVSLQFLGWAPGCRLFVDPLDFQSFAVDA